MWTSPPMSSSAQGGDESSNLAQVAQGQMMQAAMSSGASAASTTAPMMDLASILAKIQSLEKEKADMRAQLDVTSCKLSKLQESKRAEMEQMMNSTITKWLENLNTTDAAAKDRSRMA
jgi:hypothetical protein